MIVHSRYRSAAPSGENVVVDREAAALEGAGHAVERFERDSDDIAGWSVSRKLAVPARTIWNEEVRRELVSRLRETRPDVVHVHNTFPLLSPSVLHACRVADVPVVATLHNYKLLCASGDFFRDDAPCHDCGSGSAVPGLVHGCYRDSRLATLPVVAATTLHRRAWRELVSAFVFISSAQRDKAIPLRLPAERVFVKHNFVPAPASAVGRPAQHVVAYVGRLDAAKGVPTLMRAWDGFRREHPDSSLRLVIAGGGPLAAEVGRWGATRSSIDVVGLLPPHEVADLLGRALAVVVPSQWEETFGLVAVEAMAAGTAPVAAAHGAFPELVTSGVDGELFPATDARALIAILNDVDQHPHRWARLGAQALRTHRTRFSPESGLAQLLDIYRFATEHPIGSIARATGEQWSQHCAAKESS